MQGHGFWSPTDWDVSSGSAMKYLPASQEVTLTSDPLAPHLRAELKLPLPSLGWWHWNRCNMIALHAVSCTHKLVYSLSRCSMRVLYTGVFCFYAHFLSPEWCCKSVTLMTLFQKRSYLLCVFSQLERAVILSPSAYLIHPCSNPLYSKLSFLHC